MTQPTRTEREQWGTILELSTRMLELAEIRDWFAYRSNGRARQAAQALLHAKRFGGTK